MKKGLLAFLFVLTILFFPKTATAQALPDLYISDISCTLAAFVGGGGIDTPPFGIINTGDEIYCSVNVFGGPVETFWRTAGGIIDPFGSWIISSLDYDWNPPGAAGTTWLAAESLKYLVSGPSGFYTYGATADDLNNVVESNESNNTGSTTFFVNAAEAPTPTPTLPPPTPTPTPTTPPPTPTTAPPTCIQINGLGSLITGQTETYTATTGGSIISYSWSASGGSPTTGSSSSFGPWSSSSAGSFTINLTVSGPGGSVSCPPKTVTVKLLPPTATPTPTTPPPTPTTEGGGGGTPAPTPPPSISCSFNMSPVTNPLVGEGRTFTSTSTASGTTITSWAWSVSPTTNNSPTSESATITFPSTGSWSASAAGSYTVNLSVNDGPGGASPTGCSLVVNVSTPTPTPTVGPGTPTPTPGGATPTPTPSSAVTVDLLADGQLAGKFGSINIANSSSHTLSWTSSNATSCSPSLAWSGAKALSGSEGTGVLSDPPASRTYRIDCTGPGGSDFDTVTLNISSAFPFLQTKEGAVHTQQDINTPGGP